MRAAFRKAARSLLLAVAALCLGLLSFAPSASITGFFRGQPVYGSAPELGDEFVGPFANWANVKTDYGAVGDGETDDTAAFQAALDDIATDGHDPTLYIPAGTYLISDTLHYTPREFTNIIGEHPDTTILKWQGGIDGPLLFVDGVNYSRFNRLTFDGSGEEIVLVDQAGRSPNFFFDTGNEYADDVFKDADIGIRCGYGANGCSEMSVLRSQFLYLRLAGIFTANFNALDIWVWNSVFDHNGTGVTNQVIDPLTGNVVQYGAGNFHVYNSVFRESQRADLAIGNTSHFSFRNNYSIGSRRFIEASGSNNPAPTVVEGNLILNPTDSEPIHIGNQGPVVLYDNIVRASTRGPSGIFTVGDYACTGDAVAVANTYTFDAPILGVCGRGTEIDTQFVASSSIGDTEPILPGVEPNANRNITELAPGATVEQIQAAIDEAVSLHNGERPVVHLAAGDYSATSTITIPANSDVQVVGDGHRTHLTWSGTTTGPVIYLPGPTRATLRDINVDGNNGQAESIVAALPDQPGSRVFVEGSLLTGAASSDNVTLVEGLDNTFVEFRDTQRGGQGGTGLTLTGGPKAAAGQAHQGLVLWDSGSGYGDNPPVEASQGATLVLRDYWYESVGEVPYVHVSGRAEVTIENNHTLAAGGDDTPAHHVTNLIGKVAFLAGDFGERIVIGGDGSDAELLALGMLRYTVPDGPYFFNDASPPAYASLLHGRDWTNDVPGTATVQAPHQGSGVTEDGIPTDFVRSMLAQTRTVEAQSLRAIEEEGLTDLRMFGIWAVGGLNSLRITFTPPAEEDEDEEDDSGGETSGRAARGSNAIGTAAWALRPPATTTTPLPRAAVAELAEHGPATSLQQRLNAILRQINIISAQLRQTADAR